MKVFGRVIVLVCVLLFVVGLARGRAQFFFLGNPLEGKSAPDFTLPTLNQPAVSWQAYRQGQAAILFFWATWCPHCRTALQDLESRKDMIQSQGIKIILVDTGERKGQVADYMKTHNISLDVFLDEDQDVARQYGIVGVPTFILVSQDGIIRSVKHTLPENFVSLINP